MNPLADKRPENPLLSLRELGFSEKDLDLQVSSKFFLDNRKMTLREMIAALRRTFMPTRSAPSFSTSRIRASATGSCTGSNRVRRKHHASTRGADRDCFALCSKPETFESFSAHPLRRAEALFAPGRGIAHGDSRHDSASLPGRGDRGNLHGHGASRPAQCAWRISCKKSLRVIFTEFSHQLHSGPRRGRRRREISPRLSDDPKTRIRRGGRDPARRQSEPSRGGQSGRRRDGARPAAHSRRHGACAGKFCRLLIHGDARFRGPGHRRGNAQHVAAPPATAPAEPCTSS